MANGVENFIATGILPDGFMLRDGCTMDVFEMADVMVAASNARKDYAKPYVFSRTLVRQDVSGNMAMPLAWSHVVEQPEGMAGFVIGYPSTETKYAKSDPLAEHLSLLMVHPRDWGKGVAKALLGAAAHTVKLRQKTRLSLWAAESNVRARGVYELNGYKLTGAQLGSNLQGLLLEYMVDLSLNG